MHRSSAYFVFVFILVLVQIALFRRVDADDLTAVKQKPVEQNDYCFGNFCIDRREFGFVLNLQHRLEQCEKERDIESQKKYKKQLEKVEKIEAQRSTGNENNRVKINSFLKQNPRFRFLNDFDNYVHRN